MKKVQKLFLTTVLLFVFLFLFSNFIFGMIITHNNDSANIYMNRFFYALQERISDEDPVQIGALIEKLRAEHIAEDAADLMPEQIRYIPIEAGDSEVAFLNKEGNAPALWALHHEGKIIGFVEFVFRRSAYVPLQILINAALSVAFLITMSVCIFINTSVLRPFGKLSSYPEKLSKNEISEKLPESKNRTFGQFIWGINMLSDRLENDRKQIGELNKEHMTMMTTIAHGIKTPVANIKLYAEAIRTGLYQEDGIANEADAEVAEKIVKNADDVADLVKELIENSSKGIVNFEPRIESFYLQELLTFLNEEFGKRLEILRIPFEPEMGHNAMVKSDKSGICRILSQLMENAMKYGNGKGIRVSLEKENDGYYFSVINKGKVPEDSELPYLFNSFWRGSNSAEISGSGIGLFEAREIARKLYGDIYVKTDPEKEEIEFDVFIPAGC